MSCYSILVTSSPYDNQGSQRALTFCHQLLNDGHVIEQVFFYQGGIYNALQEMTPPGDETNYYAQWSLLKVQHKVPLRVCVTAGEKRGVVLQQHVIDSPFEQTGLGEFFAGLHQSEHVVQF